MRQAEQLARHWMPGTRQASNGPGSQPRPAWMHPQDLVKLIEELFPAAPVEISDIAWLHDIIEDGVKPDGAKVQADDLRAAGFAEDIISDIEALSQREGEPKPEYLARLSAASPRAKLVKCVDRVCNLREGKEVFKDKRWARYVDETHRYVLPLVEGFPEGSVLRPLLEAAAAARAVV